MDPAGVLKRTNLNIFNMDFKILEFLSPLLDPSKSWGSSYDIYGK